MMQCHAARGLLPGADLAAEQVMDRIEGVVGPPAAEIAADDALGRGKSPGRYRHWKSARRM